MISEVRWTWRALRAKQLVVSACRERMEKRKWKKVKGTEQGRESKKKEITIKSGGLLALAQKKSNLVMASWTAVSKKPVLMLPSTQT